MLCLSADQHEQRDQALEAPPAYKKPQQQPVRPGDQVPPEELVLDTPPAPGTTTTVNADMSSRLQHQYTAPYLPDNLWQHTDADSTTFYTTPTMQDSVVSSMRMPGPSEGGTDVPGTMSHGGVLAVTSATQNEHSSSSMAAVASSMHGDVAGALLQRHAVNWYVLDVLTFSESCCRLFSVLEPQPVCTI